LRDERRRLAAILAADVAGYSRLMAADESDTLARLKQLRAEVFEPKIAQYHGRIVGSAGDSLLIEFASAVNAVHCAIEVQRELGDRNADLPEDRRMAFRMGVNLGDVIAEDDTIHGQGVNVAARLEKLAEPGGICVGRAIYDQVRGKLACAYDDLGEQRVHNVPEPVRAYRVRPAKGSADSSPGLPSKGPLPLPDKPSIAVLPFQNLSADPEQEYFADGMVEEIITALSRLRWLFVIARNSSFTYKGRAVDVKEVGRVLGVRYVLEGSVRKAGKRVRITGQLIDTSTGAHLWADRFEGAIEDIFDLQDQMSASVVGAIAPRLEQAEIDRAKRKPTDNLDAYDYYLRGLACVYQWTREASDEALSMFYKAIELDPNFALAYGMAARCYPQRKASGWVTDRVREIAEAERLARRAAELGREDALALCTAGIALGYVVGDLDDGAALIDRALQLNPNLVWAWHYSGWIKVWQGEPEVAIERFARAMRLSPQDPQIFNIHAATALAHFFASRYAEALSWAGMAIREQPHPLIASCAAAASAALTGQMEEAQKAMMRVRKLDPSMRLSSLKELFPIRRSEDYARWAEGLRRAGLPE
jgi:adenylate cyclase